jgi:predicted YcjX-like family ATPase
MDPHDQEINLTEEIIHFDLVITGLSTKGKLVFYNAFIRKLIAAEPTSDKTMALGEIKALVDWVEQECMEEESNPDSEYRKHIELSHPDIARYLGRVDESLAKIKNGLSDLKNQTR